VSHLLATSARWLLFGGENLRPQVPMTGVLPILVTLGPNVIVDQPFAGLTRASGPLTRVLAEIAS